MLYQLDDNKATVVASNFDNFMEIQLINDL